MQLYSFCLQLMIGCCKKRREIIRENAFEQKKKKPGLKFNPGLVVIGLRTTVPRVSIFFEALSSKA